MLRVGGVPEHFNFPWLTAIETGAARQLGLELAWQDYPTGTGAMLADLVEGEIDLAVLLTEGAALGLARHLPIEAISLYTESPLIWGIHVHPASRLDSVDALPGARFAVSRHGSGSHLMSLALALDRGWPRESIEFVVVGDINGAIESIGAGRSDAFLWEHFTTEPAVRAGHFRRIGDFVSPWPAWVVCTRQGLDARDRLHELIGVVAECAADLADDPTTALRIAAHYGLDEAGVRLWLEGTRWVERPTEPASALAAATAMLREAGAIGA